MTIRSRAPQSCASAAIDPAGDADLATCVACALKDRSFLPLLGPALAVRFDTDTRDDRVAHLRRMIYLGVCFFDFYVVVDPFTLHRFLWLSIALKALALTPMALTIAYLVDKVSDRMREAVCAFGAIVATAIPLLLFFLSDEPTSLATAVEVLLCVLYCNITIALRFPWACRLSALSLLGMASVLCDKPAVGGGSRR